MGHSKPVATPHGISTSHRSYISCLSSPLPSDPTTLSDDTLTALRPTYPSEFAPDPYNSAIGSHIFLMQGTRSEIAFSAGWLA